MQNTNRTLNNYGLRNLNMTINGTTSMSQTQPVWSLSCAEGEGDE